MKILLGKNDIIMSGSVLAGLEYSSPDLSDMTGMPAIGMDKEAMLERLRRSQSVALELLSTGDSPIIYMGDHARIKDGQGRSLGMRFTDGGSSVQGDNLYGRFLMDIRSIYREEMRNSMIMEKPLREGQILVDFVPAGSNKTYIESLERDGLGFIHVEPYKSVQYKRNSALDGTTGYSKRITDSDVSFQTFECPFGIEYKSKIRVSTAAEASFLYEQALRGELDWKALFRDLRNRGLMKELSAHEQEIALMDMKAQFSWMRERIANDFKELQDKDIVADLFVIPDSSFGRSVYDVQTAPSPAHILARYVNNPELLFASSENLTLKALSMVDKNEPYRFSAINGVDEVTIVVDGSDTIGGRSVGTRAVKEKRPVYRRDAKGNIMYDRFGDPVVDTTVDAFKLAFKSKEEIEVDYHNFSGRLDDIIANISEDVKITFLSGKGVGTSHMLQRYVQERAGKVYEWDYLNRMAEDIPYDKPANLVEGRKMELIRVPGFTTVLPVILGQQHSVDFILDVDGKEQLYTFKRGEIPSPSGYVTFSVKSDARYRAILDRAGVAVNAGISVIHVQENASEEEQKLELESGASLSRSSLIGEMNYEGSLFQGDLRKEWEIAPGDRMSFVDPGSGLAFPYVSFIQDATVYVNNIPFHTVYSAYAALLLKSEGDVPIERFQELSKNEDSISYVAGLIKPDYPDDVIEKCMRNAVHMMAQASLVFSDTLLSTNDTDIVMRSSFGGLRDFTDTEGHGENRFGIVLMSERNRLVEELFQMRQRSEEESRKIAEENNRLQRKANIVRAPGEKHVAGFPKSIEESAEGIWFVGTSRPASLTLPDDEVSFIQWEERDYGRDALNRELASRLRIEDGEGGLVDNKFIFLYPTDLLAVLGTRHVKNNPDSKDLTGVTRVNPETGQVFTCAYGIPVKKDNYYYERDNKLGRVCSFRLDNDSSELVNSVIHADALARSTALKQGMSLCYSIRQRPLSDGEENDDLSRVFNDKIWDYPRTTDIIDRNTGKTISEAGSILPTEVTTRVYNRQTRSYENVTKEVKIKKWIDNPHAAPRNKSIIRRYQNILKEGASLPLNCICLPKVDYSKVPEEQFLADFSFTLSLMNATALATGKPMRFPLDENGRLMLGPDIPERYRDMAERKLDSFIGVVKNEDIINGPLPYVSRIPVSSAFRNDIPLKGDGSDIYLRPNDLMVAFGPYEFNKYQSNSIVPIHEMAFTMDDGTVFKVTGNRFSHNLTSKESNAYYRYDKNDEIRFSVKSSNPDRIPEFINVLRSYVERAKRIKTEFRLISEEDATKEYQLRKSALMNSGYSEEVAENEADSPDMAGFVNLLSSNSDKVISDIGDVGARQATTMVELEREGKIDEYGHTSEGVYHGREDAKDGFKGYVQIRYMLPDGLESEWKIIKDTELAVDIVMSNVKRVYRSDLRELPSKKVLEAKLKAYAVKAAGEDFRSLTQEVVLKKVDTKEVGINAKSSVTKSNDSVSTSAKSVEISDAPELKQDDILVFTRSSGSYSQRTYENANADDVTFTLAFAVDFNTAGERATMKAAGSSCIPVELPVSNGKLDITKKAVKAAVKEIVNSLPDEFLKGEPCGFNIAGNGIYTLAKHGIEQEDVDKFVSAVLQGLKLEGMRISSLRSGGQTGVDESVAAAGFTLGVKTIIHAPSSWAYRGKDGRDIKGDEGSFKKRFEVKNYEALRNWVYKSYARNSRKSSELKH